ncbi:hypothetical protein RhiJN_00305 [Ceratobasidium sp. AG-Ba]|nr:hypothetical protein RhiJN_00305 [Ceratobasidium sp. AG-Ba]
MLTRSFATGILLLSSCANAFQDTVPVVAWSSPHSSSAIDSLKDNVPSVPSHTQLIEALVSDGDLCTFDAVVVVGQSGLHATQLAALPSNSNLKSRLLASSSKAHFPYVPIASSADSRTIVREIAALCGSASAQWPAEHVLENTMKHVLHLDLPELSDKDWASYDVYLEHNLDEISSRFDSHAVILTGTRIRDPTLITKRQQPNSLSAPGFINHPASSFANATLPVGGILARYQLLTPGLLLSLLIAFGLLIPLLMIGITALASIQNPIRTEVPKGPSLEKKNQ